MTEGRAARAASSLGGLVVALGLALVLFYPAAAATVRALRSAEAGESSTRPTLAAPPRPGEVVRPLALAAESIRLATGAEVVALPVGLALAFVLARTDLWGRRGMLLAVGLAAFVPTPLLATAWLGGFGNVGRAQAIGGGPVLAGWPGASFLHAMAALPWVVLVGAVGFRSVEPDLEALARLDLTPIGVATRVTLRRSLWAIAAAALAVAVLTVGDMTITDLLQVRTYAEEAYTRYQLGDPSGAAFAAVPPLAMLGTLIALGCWALARLDPARAMSKAARSADWRLGRWRIPAGLFVLATAGNLVALPAYSLIWRAGRVGGRAGSMVAPHWSPSGLVGSLRLALGELVGPILTRPMRSPIASTLLISAASAALAVSLAWSMAWLARDSRAWRVAAVLAVALGLGIPGPVMGMSLVIAYQGWMAVYDSPIIVVLAQAARTLPYAALVTWPAVRGLPTAWIDQARVDGLGPVARAFRVGLPSTLGVVGAGWGVAFALAIGELPASNLVAPPGTVLLSVRVWELLHTGVESHLAGVGLMTLVLLGLSGSMAAWALRRAYRTPAR